MAKLDDDDDLSNLCGIQTETIQQSIDRAKVYLRWVAQGQQNGLILTGIAGIGKTHTVRETLDGLGVDYAEISSPNVHVLAYDLFVHRHKAVVIMDDADHLAGRAECINLCKTAFGDEHRLFYNTSKIALNHPLNCRLVWISNIDYSNPETRRKNMAAHWDALSSRGILPIWIGPSEFVKPSYDNQTADVLKYTVKLVLTEDIIGEHGPMGKAKAERLIRLFIERRNFWLELTPRLFKYIRDIFRHAENRDELKTLLQRYLAPEAICDVEAIPYPTIIGRNVWTNVAALL